MKALFADISERARQRHRDIYAYKAHERRQVLALCDAIQIAVARGHHDRADMLLKEMQAIVDTALARRHGVRS
jgi:hypothetical protein